MTKTPGEFTNQLRQMRAEAEALAAHMQHPDFWAKPFYSDIATFCPRVNRAFIGLNGAGDSGSHQLDLKQGNHAKVWLQSTPFHNAFLDESWGKGSGSTAPPGQSQLQVAVQKVYQIICGADWKEELRATACFNLCPVSSTDFARLAAIHADAVDWGWRLLSFLQPQNLIVCGSGVTDHFRSYTRLESHEFRRNQRARIRRGVIRWPDGTETAVLELPHLSHYRGSDLYSKLNEIVVGAVGSADPPVPSRPVQPVKLVDKSPATTPATPAPHGRRQTQEHAHGGKPTSVVEKRFGVADPEAKRLLRRCGTTDKGQICHAYHAICAESGISSPESAERLLNVYTNILEGGRDGTGWVSGVTDPSKHPYSETNHYGFIYRIPEKKMKPMISSAQADGARDLLTSDWAQYLADQLAVDLRACQQRYAGLSRVPSRGQ